jgi:hypothetical protein
MTCGCAYDDSSGHMTLALRVLQEQEEGGYEEASYHQGAENGEQEAHVESAVLYQPIPVNEDAPRGPRYELAEQCLHSSSSASRARACTEYASLFGEALKAIKKGWKAVKAGVHAAWRFVGEETVSWESRSLNTNLTVILSAR